MKVLWICNMMPAAVASRLGLPYSNKEGWVSALCERLLEDEGADLTLGICFPYEGDIVPAGEEASASGKREGILEGSRLHYYGFEEDTVHEEKYESRLEDRMKEILEAFQPDLIHIFGTEYGHTLAALKVFNKPEKSLIGLQGICYKIAEHYLDGIPEKVVNRSTPRDLLKGDNLKRQQEKMYLRGEREKECLKLTGHVAGRTTFDRESALTINPDLQYHLLNETLRKTFYDGEWTLRGAERCRIFMSQGNYPVKGLHFALKAIAGMIKDFPQLKLCIAGDNITGTSAMGRLKISSYGQYLRDLITEGGLESRVTFLGPLSADRMKEEMLKSHVFLSASTIENSPNSVGEAMLLGLPVVASEVGGVGDILLDGRSGLLYSEMSESALRSALGRILTDDDTAEKLSAVGRDISRIRHDADTNYETLLRIYNEI